MKFLSSSQLSEHRYKTPEGYLVCLDCILARTGKQQYQMSDLFTDGDDTEVDVDRPEVEVFNPKTLASFENKPFTNEHPSTDVNPNNYNELSVGFVRDIRKGSENGKDVMIGNIIVTDPDTINDIESGNKNELSCGYDCDIIKDENGNYKQVNIRGNHVALCEHGRAGIARIVDSNNVKDSLSSEVRNWWRKVEEANHTNDWGFDINNFGSDDEDMLSAMFDMISDLKGKDNNLYQEGKRIYNKYSKYSQYKDSKVKDDVFESRYYEKNKLRVSEDFLEKICNKYNIDVYYEGNEYRLYGLNKNFDNMFSNYRLFDSKVKDVEPRQGESKEDFISRFMSATKSEYPDEKQRLAVAYSYWNKQHDSVNDISFNKLTEVQKQLKEELGLYKRQIGSHQPTGKIPYQSRQSGSQVQELNESINEAIKNIDSGITNENAWTRLQIKLEAWKGEPEFERLAKRAADAIEKFKKYLNIKDSINDDYSGFLGNYGFDYLKGSGDYEYWYYKDKEDIQSFNKAVQRIRLEYPQLIISSGTSQFNRPVIYIQKSKYTKDSIKDNKFNIFIPGINTNNVSKSQQIANKYKVQLVMVDYDYNNKGFKMYLEGEENNIMDVIKELKNNNLIKDSINDSTIVNCPDMSLQEMREYCELYQCEVYNTGVNGKYRLEGKDVDEVLEELKADGFIKDSVKDEDKKELLHKWGFINNGTVLRHPEGTELKFKYNGFGNFRDVVGVVEARLGIRHSYIDYDKEEVNFFKKHIEDSKPTKDVAQIAKVAKIAKVAIDAMKAKDAKKVYRINAYKYDIKNEDWTKCLNFLKSKGVDFFVSDYLDIITEDINVAKQAREILHINQMEIDTPKLRKEYEYLLDSKVKDYDQNLLNELQKIAQEGEKIKADVDKAYKAYYNVGNYYSWQKLKQENPQKYDLIIKVKEQQERKVSDLANKWDKIINILNRGKEGYQGHFDTLGGSHPRLPDMNEYQEVLARIKSLEKTHGKTPYSYDSIKDSPASDIVAEIKRTYPQVKMTFRTNPMATTIEFDLDTLPESRLNWQKYLEHLVKKYGKNPHDQAYTGSILLFKDSKVKDFDSFTEVLDKLSRFGVKYKEIPNDKTRGIAYDITYEKYLTGQSIKQAALNFGKHIINHEPGRIVVGDNKNTSKLNITNKPVKDATSNECIEKLKTVSIPEGFKFEYGDMSTTMVQIQNTGKNEVSLNLQTGSTSTKQLSNAWGRIWKQGKLIFSEQDAINVVRAHMIEKLRMLQDSKK